MASYRHLARTCVMQTIFELEFREKGDPYKILESILDEFAPKLTEKQFAHDTLTGILQHKEAILKDIQTYAPQWPIDKIAAVDRAVLEIGVYEILYHEDVPDVVAINEAVEVAKHFGDSNSPKFVNGVLSSIMSAKSKKT